MRRPNHRADLVAAVVLAVSALIVAPGLAIVAVAALAVLVISLITTVRSQRALRRGSSRRSAAQRSLFRAPNRRRTSGRRGLDDRRPDPL